MVKLLFCNTIPHSSDFELGKKSNQSKEVPIGVRKLYMVIILMFLIGGGRGAVIPTTQRTSILPYSLPLGARDPHHQYSFYHGRTNQDMAVHGFYHVTDSKIIYLTRKSKFDSHNYKLIRYDMLTNSEEVYPANDDEFIQFRDLEIYAFTLSEFPRISSILGYDVRNNSVAYYEFDTTNESSDPMSDGNYASHTIIQLVMPLDLLRKTRPFYIELETISKQENNYDFYIISELLTEETMTRDALVNAIIFNSKKKMVTLQK